MRKLVSQLEVQQAFGFLLLKVMDMELKTDDGHEICPMFGFCPDCEECFLDRYMKTFPPICSECGETIDKANAHLN